MVVDSIKEVVFDYLDRNTTIVNSEIHIEDESAPRISTIFSTDDVDFHDWAMDRVGERYGDEPAFIYGEVGVGDSYVMEWFKNGKLHRENNKPAIIHSLKTFGRHFSSIVENNNHPIEIFQEQWWVEDEYIRMNRDLSSGMRFTSRGKGSLGLLIQKDYTLSRVVNTKRLPYE